MELTEWNSPIPVRFSSLIPKMLTFTLPISCLTTSNLPCHGPNIPGSYAILLFTASDFSSIISHIHNWVLFLLWLHLFSLSGVTSSLFSSSILGTSWRGEFIFQCPIFFPFHTVHGVLKARILKWFAIPFSSGPHFVRTLHHDPSVWVALHSVAHSFIELDKVVVHVSRLVSFLWLCIVSVLCIGT